MSVESDKSVNTSPSKDLSKTINIAVSSRALFDLEEEHEVFIKEGLKEYIKFQLSREDDIIDKGPAFPFIKILENINAKLRDKNPKEEKIFAITLMSHNDAEVAIRLQKSIDHYKDEGLNVSRMALTSGTSVVNYLKPFKITLLLTSYEGEVTSALREGIAAAVMSLQPMNSPSETQLRIAFDLDAVLFSDESERIFKEEGLPAFREHETENKNIPLSEGPLKPFAHAIGEMQKKLDEDPCPIRTYAVTARDANAAHRPLTTLREWGLKLDESFFMAGSPKDEILKVINPHIFFDDQKTNVDGARKMGTPAGHVKYDANHYDHEKKEGVKKELFSET